MTRLSRAIEAFDLREYVEEQFTDLLPADHGNEIRLNCFAPKGCAGSDTKRKLYVNPEKKQWICFKCGYGTHSMPGTGSLVRFMCDVEGVPPLIIRHRLAGLVVPAAPEEGFEELLHKLFLAPPPPPKPLVRVVELPRTFFPLTMDKRSPYVAYLADRNFTASDAVKYDVRLCMHSDKKLWGGRVVFPLYDNKGRLRSYAGRTIFNKEPKWIYEARTDLDQLMWPIGTYHLGKKWKDCIALVEGIFDAFMFNQLSDTWPALCTFGKKITQGQLKLLRKLRIAKVLLAWDYDARDEMLKARSVLEEWGFEVFLFPFIDPLWQDRDLGSLTLSEQYIFQKELKYVYDSHDYLGNKIGWIKQWKTINL